MQKHSTARAIAGANWNPRDGLIGSDQGFWYDPSDLATLFQDAAGTIPVTAVEQLVGRMLDKSGRGNHATNPSGNSANFPVLSARYNLLTKTDQFDAAAWVSASNSAAVSKGTTSGTRPDGTTGTINTLTFPVVSAGGFTFLYQNVGQTLLNIQATQAIYVRVSSGTATVFLNMEDMAAAPSGGNFVAGSAETVTTSWRRISLTGTRTSVSGNTSYAIGFDTRANAGQTNPSPVTIEVWGADIRPTNQASLPYQRVNTSTDYDSDATKFPRRINYAAGQSMTVIFPASLGNSCVVARANPGVSAVIAENQTVNTPLTLNTNHSGLVITSRAISVDEKARLDEYLDKKAIAK